MPTLESDITYQLGPFWVLRDRENNAYTVLTNGVTHSTPDSSYALNDDGRSLAIARCNYMYKRAIEKVNYLQNKPDKGV